MTNSNRLVADVAQKCLKHNIGFHLVPDTAIRTDEIHCSGYFDEKELVVAAHKPDWLDVLVHESCHFDQFTEKYKLWGQADTSLHLLEGWLSTKKVSLKRLVPCIQNIIELELDCEIRTIKKIKKYKLNINTKKYIQQANSYLFSYWATLRDRKWYPFPYNKPHIVKKMPTKFLPLQKYFDPEIELLELYI